MRGREAMIQDFRYDTFLSYSWKDRGVVRELAQRLKKDGLRVWFDEWEIKVGDNIPAKIEEGLEHSRVLVLFMSANAFGADWVKLESGTFRFRDPLNKDRRFVPVRLDEAVAPGSLGQFAYVDWRAGDREGEYAKLLQACRLQPKPARKSRARDVRFKGNGGGLRSHEPQNSRAKWTFEDLPDQQTRAYHRQLCEQYVQLDSFDLLELCGKWRRLAESFTKEACASGWRGAYVVHDVSVYTITQLLETACADRHLSDIDRLGRCLRRPDGDHLHYALALLDELEARLRAQVIATRTARGIPEPRKGTPGVVPVEEIRTAVSRLPGEVFAIELLQRPIQLVRRADGGYRIIIDRRDVKHAIITTKAKREICRQYVKGREKKLKELDDRVHEFLLGKTKDESFTIDLPGLRIPLRWASGGVMSVVTRKDKPGEKWTPFFFRDIAPSGWNLSLGSCEREFDDRGKCTSRLEAELNDPHGFLLREFLEETLILNGPPQVGSTLRCRQFYFDRTLVWKEQKLSGRFAAKHIALRQEEDCLKLECGPKRGNGASNSGIRVGVSNGAMETVVIDPHGTHHLHSGFLVTFNVLELGIEVVRVVDYEIEPSDYFLDGEVLLHPDGFTELVRMPVALISHQALRRSFAPGSYRPRYTASLQPSFIGKSIRANEIKVFDWDIKQRLEKIKSLSRSDREWKLHMDRYKRLCQVLLTKSGDVNYANVPSLFIPAAAKTLSLYFSKQPSLP